MSSIEFCIESVTQLKQYLRLNIYADDYNGTAVTDDEGSVSSQTNNLSTVVSGEVRLSRLSQKAASRVFASSIFIRYN
jgi:hypothetical protein